MPNNWKASAKVRVQLQSILKETETESENTGKGKQTTPEMIGHCCSGDCISRTRGHQEGLACQRHSVRLVPARGGGDLKYLFMMAEGSTKQIKVIFAAIKNDQISEI